MDHLMFIRLKKTNWVFARPPCAASDLFHRVIAQSGSMLTDWALDRKAREHGLRITELAGCPLEPYDGPNGTLHCLRTIDAETLLRAEREANVSKI